MLNLKVSLINDVVFLQLDSMNGNTTVILLSWNSSKALSLSVLEKLAKKVLVKRNQMAKGQRLQVNSLKHSEQPCPDDVFNDTFLIQSQGSYPKIAAPGSSDGHPTIRKAWN